MPSRWTLKKKRRIGLNSPSCFRMQHAVRAEVDVLAALEDLRRPARPISRVEQRLAAADRDDGRAALVHGRRHCSSESFCVMVVLVLADPAASRAGQVAGVQRLQHQHQREPLADHRVGLRARCRCRCLVDDPERIRAVARSEQVLLPLRPRPQLVPGRCSRPCRPSSKAEISWLPPIRRTLHLAPFLAAPSG